MPKSGGENGFRAAGNNNAFDTGMEHLKKGGSRKYVRSQVHRVLWKQGSYSHLHETSQVMRELPKGIQMNDMVRIK